MPGQVKQKKHPEIKGLLILISALFLALSTLSFTQGMPEHNWMGLIGYFIALASLYLLGLGTYLLIAYLSWVGWLFLTKEERPSLGMKTFYFTLFTLSVCSLLNLMAETKTLPFSFLEKHIFSEVYEGDYPFFHRMFRFNLGGVPLYYLYRDLPTFNLIHLLSNSGVFTLFSILSLLSFILFTNTHLLPCLKKIGAFLKGAHLLLLKVMRDLKGGHKPKRTTLPLPSLVKKPFLPIPPPPLSPHLPLKIKEQKEISAESTLLLDTEEDEETDRGGAQERPLGSHVHVTTFLERKKTLETKGSTQSSPYEGDFKHYRLPPLHLLTQAKKVDQPSLKKDLARQAEVLEETLLSFGIEAKVGEINCGPTVVSFEVHPSTGVKVQKIKALESDIALNLQAKSIRIIAPIPGKAAVGIEIPSPFPQEVGFKEMLSEYQKGKKLHIPVLLGQTVTGENVMCDLTKMPHCIIAGTTGSGKSVCINSIVMSVLMTARPDEVRLLLIDPKKVELSAYTNLPHLIAPVITEPHGAYSALNWLVKEMQHRYEILKRLGLRNIHAFNHRRFQPQVEAEIPLEIPRKMPYLLTIIDEFADLMMVSSSDLETPIARIAQMARAVGIHLILATQRPSREVVTGIIKANCPCCIAFKAASRVNSQIILGDNGANNLLGNGDLLFRPPGTSQLIRAQGVFVRDEDISRVIAYIEKEVSPQYLIKSFDKMNPEDLIAEGENPRDGLYEQAYAIVTQTSSASTTLLQRKLKIGYPRAASLIDELEARGVIGAQEGSRPRRVIQTEIKKGG